MGKAGKSQLGLALVTAVLQEGRLHGYKLGSYSDDTQSQHFTPPSRQIQEEWDITYNRNYHGFTGNVQATYSPYIWPETSWSSLWIFLPISG